MQSRGPGWSSEFTTWGREVRPAGTGPGAHHQSYSAGSDFQCDRHEFTSGELFGPDIGSDNTGRLPELGGRRSRPASPITHSAKHFRVRTPVRVQSSADLGDHKCSRNFTIGYHGFQRFHHLPSHLIAAVVETRPARNSWFPTRPGPAPVDYTQC